MALVAKNPAATGTIWIGKNYNSVKAGDANLLFDGLTLTMMAEYDLTIQGGWDGLGKETIDPNIPSTLDGISLLIFSWKGNITLKDLRMQNAIGDSGKAALCVRTASSIQLERVLANNSLYGSSLDNTASLSSPPALVTVAASDFSRNDYAGLAIYTKGAVTLQNVIANRNLLGYGISILNTNDIAASPVTVSDGQFNENNATGLTVQSNGVVILNSVPAQANGRRGTAVDNRYGSGDVLLQGTNTFLCNSLHGWKCIPKAGLPPKSDGHRGWRGRSLVVDQRPGRCGHTGLTVLAAVLKLQGFRSYMNGTNEDIQTVAPVLRKPCPSWSKAIDGTKQRAS